MQELSTKLADLKSQANERAAAHRVSFATSEQPQPQQYQQQQPQYQQQQQHPYGAQPTLMWDQNAMHADGRQSGSWPRPQTAQGSPGEIAAAAQLPQLLQKLQRTQEKLETRDASARKYKVG